MTQATRIVSPIAVDTGLSEMSRAHGQASALAEVIPSQQAAWAAFKHPVRLYSPDRCWRAVAEPALEFIPRMHEERVVVRRRVAELEQSDAVDPPLLALDLLIAAAYEHPMEPGLEALRFTQLVELFPGLDERLLHSILGQVSGAQDAIGDSEYPIADRAGDDTERVRVAVPGLLDEVSVHAPAPG